MYFIITVWVLGLKKKVGELDELFVANTGWREAVSLQWYAL
jgi:hypothetical protein